MALQHIRVSPTSICIELEYGFFNRNILLIIV